jgi:hypothetical protein
MASPYRLDRDPEAALAVLSGRDGQAQARLSLYRDRVELHTRSQSYELRRVIFLAPDAEVGLTLGGLRVRRGELEVRLDATDPNEAHAFAAEMRRALPIEQPRVEARGAMWRCRRDAGYAATAAMMPGLPLLLCMIGPLDWALLPFTALVSSIFLAAWHHGRDHHVELHGATERLMILEPGNASQFRRIVDELRGGRSLAGYKALPAPPVPLMLERGMW